MTQATIPAGEFKTHCLQLLDQVAATGESLMVTKHGRPVARLVPTAARQAIDRAAGWQQLWVSVITPWEIAMRVAKQWLTLDCDVMVWIDTALAQPGLRARLGTGHQRREHAASRGVARRPR